MSNSVFTFPLAQYKEFTSSIEGFIDTISDGNPIAPEWIEGWKTLNKLIPQIMIFERKWAGFKVTGINPTLIIRKDINVLFRRHVRDMQEGEEAVQYGIRVTSSFIDNTVKGLPYLRGTSFYDFNQQIRDLLDAVINKTRHGEITKLLNETEKHSDFVTVGQLFTHEMVEQYRFLNNRPASIDRILIMKYFQAYEDYYSIFEKDMILTSLLLSLRDTSQRIKYSLVPTGPGTTTTADCLRKIVLFNVAFRKSLRDAKAHGNVETDSTNQIVMIYRKGELIDTLNFKQVIKYCEEISALALSFRLLVTQLALLDWIGVANILKVPLTPVKGPTA